MAGGASATTIDFNVGKGWSSSGHTYGAVTVTGATVDTNGKILTNDEYVASWSGSSGGLGICSASSTSKCTTGTSESYNRDQHTIEGANKSEMALLDFGSETVQINSVTFAYWDSNDDFDFATYASTNLGTEATLWSEDNYSNSNPSIKTFTFAEGQLVGKIFGFGADDSSDEFKLRSISYTVEGGQLAALFVGGPGARVGSADRLQQLVQAPLAQTQQRERVGLRLLHQ